MTVSAGRFPVTALKHLVSLRRSPMDVDYMDRPYVGLENIEPWTGRFVGEPTTSNGDSGQVPGTSVGKLFEPDDVLFGKLRPYLAKAWVADFQGRATSEFLVMRPANIEPRFLRYFLVSQDFVKAVDAETFGSRMPRAEWSDIGRLPVPQPKPCVQCAIADYLDRETARIDALVSAKQRLVRLTTEKGRAFVARTVARGLDPNVPMRDSGVEWLGQVPAHWATEKIAWLFRERDERGCPRLPLLEVSIDSGVALREFSKEHIESTAADFNTYKVARRHDVVFNKMRMWQGAVGAAPRDGLVSPDYVVAAPIGALTAQYAQLLFRTSAFSAECARRSHGIVWDRLRLYWEGFRDIEVCLPSAQEQAAIVRLIRQESRRLDRLTVTTQVSIKLLEERRSALISAALTGKMKTERVA